MLRTREGKSIIIVIILGGLVYYRYDIKTAFSAVLMLFTINLTAVLIPELVLTLLKRKSADFALYSRLFFGVACIVACVATMPLKVVVGIAIVSLVISGITTSAALRAYPRKDH